MSLIERIAKAMATEQGSNWDSLQGNGPGSGLRGMYIKLAREALKATREFTPEMECAAIDSVPLLEGKEARWSWEAVVDSALRGEI